MRTLSRSMHVLAALLLFGASAIPAYAKVPVGDIMLVGSLERSGQKLSNDTTLFEGDVLKTAARSGGIIRTAGGRIEMTEGTELRIVSERPLRLVLKSGAITFNLPKGTELEVLTPKLEVRPLPLQPENVRRLIGRIAAEDEDRLSSQAGDFETLKRELGTIGTERVRSGETLVASLVAMAPMPLAEEGAPILQGQGQTVAQFRAVSGDVRLQRVGTTISNRVNAPGIGLFNGDRVTTLQGQADIVFRDQSEITLSVGTSVIIEERPAPGGFFRRLQQSAGRMWFNIQRVTGTATQLETPTAVAAIRGTQGTQDVPNDTQSTHSLNEGIEEITERETRQTVTIRNGQTVTAIRGVGFTPIIALLAAIPKPAVGAGGAPGGATGGAAGGAGGTAGTAATTATASTVSTTVATVTAVSVGAGTVAAATAIPLTARDEPPRASPTAPLNLPGGG